MPLLQQVTAVPTEAHTSLQNLQTKAEVSAYLHKNFGKSYEEMMAPVEDLANHPSVREFGNSMKSVPIKEWHKEYLRARKGETGYTKQIQSKLATRRLLDAAQDSPAPSLGPSPPRPAAGWMMDEKAHLGKITKALSSMALRRRPCLRT